MSWSVWEKDSFESSQHTRKVSSLLTRVSFFIYSNLIRREEGEYFSGVYTPAALPFQTAFTLKISPYQRGRKILTAATLDEAVRGCDVYAKVKVVPGPMALGYVILS